MAGISIPPGRLVLSRGTSEAVVGIESCIMAVGGVMDGTRGRAIKKLVKSLGDIGAKMARVEPGIDSSNTTVPRSINGSDIPDTSSKYWTARILGGYKITSRISNYFGTIENAPKYGGASESTVICTMTSIR